MKKLFLNFALVTIIAVTGNQVQAQTKVVIPQGVQQSGSGLIVVDQQWEYIVVSYGKTLFATPQKTLAYRAIGLVAGQEAIDLENSLDILGRFGWEMVTIVGSIGGDQQVVLKRKYNRNLSKNESSAILKGKDLYIKDLIDIMERDQRIREEAASLAEADKNKPQLVDLDAVDAKAIRDDIDNIIIKSYKEDFTKFRPELASVSTINVTSSFGGERVGVVVTADMTSKFLRDVNTYRLNEVKDYISGQMNYYKTIHEKVAKYGSVTFIAKAIIKFNGKDVNVYTFSSTVTR
jgi:hypothetical protein